MPLAPPKIMKIYREMDWELIKDTFRFVQKSMFHIPYRVGRTNFWLRDTMGIQCKMSYYRHIAKKMALNLLVSQRAMKLPVSIDPTGFGKFST